jgi:hypothetical protein
LLRCVGHDREEFKLLSSIPSSYHHEGVFSAPKTDKLSNLPTHSRYVESAKIEKAESFKGMFHITLSKEKVSRVLFSASHI